MGIVSPQWATQKETPARARGRVIPFGKYLLLERLAVGGMAEVFLAKSFGVQGFEKLIAIKRILPTMAEDQEFIQMFIDEAKIAGHLSHANIVPIYELGKIGDAHYIAMEFVWGKDLLHIINRFRRMRERMPPAMVMWVGAMICDGLDYAHTKRSRQGEPLNLIHRDISPQNVLISYEGHVKLIDFGIARAASRTTRTQAGVLKGKFGYMSPEQVRGKAIDQRSDLFAVGTVIYEMITCERLFLGESDVSTLEKVRTVDVVPPSEVVEGVPPLLDKIVMKALAREPDDRYQSACEMRHDLQHCLATQMKPFGVSKMSAWMKRSFVEEVDQEKSMLDAFATVLPPARGEASAHGAPVANVTPLPAAEAAQQVTESPTVDEPAEGHARAKTPRDSDVDDIATASTEIFFNAEEDLDEEERAVTPSSEFPFPVLPRPDGSIGVPMYLGRSQRDEETAKHEELQGQAYAPPPASLGASKRSAAGSDSDNWRTASPQSGGTRYPALRSRKALFVLFGVAVLGALAIILNSVLGGAASGMITIRVMPAVTARVEIDGELRGTTPLVLKNVPAGSRFIVIDAEGYESTTREVIVPKDGNAFVELALVPRADVGRAKDQGTKDAKASNEASVPVVPADPDPDPAPSEAAAEDEDDAPQADVPEEVKDKARPTPSTTRRRATRPASRRPSKSSAVPAESAEPATLVVNSVPVARVFIDGKDTGRSTPIFSLKLAPGTHTVSFVTKDEKKHSFKVVLQPGETLRLNKHLD